MAQRKKKSTSPGAGAVLPMAPSTGTNPSKGKTLRPTDPSLTSQERTVLESVMRFEESEKTIQLFEDDPKHAPVMSVYKQLIEERNQLLQVAEHMVRALEVSCGPFVRSHVTIKHDPEALFTALGKDQFLAVGGSMNTETVYKVDKERVEIAIKTGAIPAAVVPSFRKETPAYKAPDPKT
jgi:hypothetical protein